MPSGDVLCCGGLFASWRPRSTGSALAHAPYGDGPPTTAVNGSAAQEGDESVLLGAEGGDYYAGSTRTASAGALSCEGFNIRQELSEVSRGMVIVLVGLPGRGKSFISRKLEGFLRWQGKRTQTFNVGKYRRNVGEGVAENGRAEFFDPKNEVAVKLREAAAVDALDDLLRFLDASGEVGVYDATNSSEARRTRIMDTVMNREPKYQVVFIEVLCNDPHVLRTNFRNKVLNSPDFHGMTLEEGIRDLEKRVKKYEDTYETIADDQTSYIKLYNMSSKVLVNRIYGGAAKSLLPFLMGIHIGTRPIWLVRAAQVPTNKGLDSDLTEDGQHFAEKLGAFVCRRMREFHGESVPDRPVKVLSSTQNSCVQTVWAFLQSSSDFAAQAFKQTSALNPIDRGRLAGHWWIDHCTDKPPFDQLRQRHPQFYEHWKENKLKCRFPGGESYYDVMVRSESVLLEVEMSTKPVLCVSHISCLQVILSYFKGTPLSEAWDVSIPEHQVVEIMPTLGGSFAVQVIDISDEPHNHVLKKGSSASDLAPRRASMPKDKESEKKARRGQVKDMRRASMPVF